MSSAGCKPTSVASTSTVSDIVMDIKGACQCLGRKGKASAGERCRKLSPGGETKGPVAERTKALNPGETLG